MQAWQPNFIQLSSLFEPLHQICGKLAEHCHWPGLIELKHLVDGSSKKIVTKSGQPIRFVPQIKSVYTFEERYEAKIYLTGEVQTRLNNWHDHFNALVWATYPKTKAVLNQLHYQSLFLEWKSGQRQRGPLRDAVTLFDESGVVVICSDYDLIKLMRNFEWKELFWKQRDRLMKHMKFFMFGHGLYEKALSPYIGMTGKGVILSVKNEFFNQRFSAQIDSIDLMLAEYMNQNFSAAKDLMPVPLLGYPGWSPDNKKEAYYDNYHYFRPRPAQHVNVHKL